MTLTGIDPTDPIPSLRRELIFGAGDSAGGEERTVLMFGWLSATNPGTEALGVIGLPVASDADAQARMGLRAPLYQMYRDYVSVDPGATIYFVAMPQGGTAAKCDWNIIAAPTEATTFEVSAMGFSKTVTVDDTFTIQSTAEALRDAFNQLDDGRLPIVATAPIDGAGPPYDVLLTTQLATIDSDHITSDVAQTFGARLRVLKGTYTAPVKALTTAGAGDSDGSAAISAATAGEYYYWVLPFHQNETDATIGSQTTVSATDNMTGEAVQAIITQALPVNDKEQVAVLGFTGTPGAATAVSQDAQMNSVRHRLFCADKVDWAPWQVAAHCAAVLRSQQVKHPAANLAGYTSSDETVFRIPDPFTKTNRPTVTEIRSMLNTGVSPVAFRPNGRPYIVREVTGRSLNADNAVDYRARPGHITSVIDFAWSLIRSRYAAGKQPFVADDPKDGQSPTAATTTPSQVAGIILGVIDDLSGSKPLGLYNGPLLAPDKVDEMKKSIAVNKIPAGISAYVGLKAVEHNYKGEFTIAETGEAY